MNERNFLLRRPRPPKHEKPLRSLVPLHDVNATVSNSHDVRYMLGQLNDARSPVPTMLSDYEPSKRSKQQRVLRIPLQSDVRSHSGRSSFGPQQGVIPYKPQGPDPFPIRLPRQALEVKHEYFLPDDPYYHKEPAFSLEDFLVPNDVSPSLPDPPPRKLVVSNANYQKLTKELQASMLASNPLEISMIGMEEQFHSLPLHEKRIPKRQTLLEAEKVLQYRLEELGVTSPSKLESESAKVGQLFNEMQELDGMQVIGIQSQISLLTRASTRVFKQARKSEMLAQEKKDGDSIITPSELAILNCLMDGGFILSLKAHFIPELPDLSPLHSTLIYLNLSFNELQTFPSDIINCVNLHVLKLRDNPLREFPTDICRLQHLRTLIISFCCLSSLPSGLFEVKTLEYLDVSYNKLSNLSNEIRNLENLRFLNVEGNELAGLPCGLLKINLFRIRIRNNFMCPVFWKENSSNTPQRLVDMCCVYIQTHFGDRKTENYKKFTPSITKQLADFEQCQCCNGPMYGSGLRIIRPCSEIWKIRRLPFIFRSCSPSCYHSFVRNTDPKIAELIYGDNSL